VDAHTFTKQVGNVYERAVGNCFLGQERSADGGIHAARVHNNVRSVTGTLKNFVELAVQNRKGVET
jgi:hypothetical protein